MINGKNVSLRGLELADVQELMKHWNKKEVKKFLLTISPHSLEEEVEWIKSTWERRKKGESYIFAIELLSEQLHIGNIELRIADQISRRGEVGIVIFNSDFCSKGHGTEALRLLLDYGFKALNLNSIELQVFETNLRAIRCYNKVGFKEVGRRRKARFSEGKYIDLLIMDILRQEFLPLE